MWFIKLHGGIVGLLSLILVIKNMFVQNSKLEGVEGSVAQTIIEEKGAKSEVV